MPSSDLPKLWTEPTKIGHIFRKQSTLRIKVFKKKSFTAKKMARNGPTMARIGPETATV